MKLYLQGYDYFSAYLSQTLRLFEERLLFGTSNLDRRGLTCDTVLVAQQPELIQDTEHLDDIAREERQLLGDAGEELKDGTHHRSRLHLSAPVEQHK